MCPHPLTRQQIVRLVHARLTGMRGKSLPAIAVLLLAACGSDDSSPQEGGGSDAVTDAGPTDNTPSACASADCSPVSECRESDGVAMCDVCPAGYSGEGIGAAGCTPMLRSLMLSRGELTPGFRPNGTEYEVSLPLLVQDLG